MRVILFLSHSLTHPSLGTPQQGPALHRQLEGRAVVYGQVIQLQHMGTSRFLSAKVTKIGWTQPQFFASGQSPK